MQSSPKEWLTRDRYAVTKPCFFSRPDPPALILVILNLWEPMLELLFPCKTSRNERRAVLKLFMGAIQRVDR